MAQVTNHWANDNAERITMINCCIGWGKQVTYRIVDRGHASGKEIHVITSTALIMVYNEATRKPITVLIARPGQLRRYFPNNSVPAELLELAIMHEQKGWNKL